MKRLVGAILLFVGLLHAADWPQFRGPNGSGVDSATGYPVSFSPSKNVVWKAAVPYAQSSPVVAGGHVYLTAADKGKLLTICLDAKTGRELWRREIRAPRTQEIFHANDPASPTPAAGDDGVIVFFPDFGLAAYTPDGKDRWTLPLGPFKNFYGLAGSPILTGEAAILVYDQQTNGFVLSVDRKTGKQRWKTSRNGANVGWATPMVFRPATGGAQLVVLGSTRLDSYFLDTGEPLWWMPLSSMGGVGVPVASGDKLLLSTLSTHEPWVPAFEAMLEKYDKNKDGKLSKEEFKEDKEMGEHFGWLDANDDGFITAAEWKEARDMSYGEFGAIAIRPEKARGKLDPKSGPVWRFEKNLPFIPAPLVYRNVYYMVKDGGIITSLDPATGKSLKEGRSREALGEYYASPVAADDKIFFSSSEGKISVVKAGGQWEVLGVNDMGEEVHATPALSDGRIYVRTHGNIYCFGVKGS